jgi:hypothetical protein
MPGFDINIKTTDDPSGIQSATNETNNLTDAMGKLLERAKKKEEYAEAKTAIAGMSDEEKAAALASYQLQQAQDAANQKIAETKPAAESGAGAIANLKNVWMETAAQIAIAKEVVNTAKEAWSETGGKVIEVTDQIRDLQMTIGATAQQASIMRVVADDAGVSMDTLQTAMEGAIRKGYEPTIANLMKMSDQYNAIQDPIARTKYLMDTFGRSGNDLAMLMREGATGIKAAGEEAQKSGQIFSQAAMDNALAFKKTASDYNDSLDAIKISIGQKLMPAATDFLKMATDLNQNLTTQQRILMAIPGIGAAYSAYLAAQEVQARKTADANDAVNASLNNQAAAYDNVRSHAHGPGDADYHTYQQQIGWNPTGGGIADPTQNWSFYGSQHASGGAIDSGQVMVNESGFGPEVIVSQIGGYILNQQQAQSALGAAGGGGAISMPLIYAPQFSLASQAEAERAILPMIERAMRTVGVKA